MCVSWLNHTLELEMTKESLEYSDPNPDKEYKVLDEITDNEIKTFSNFSLAAAKHPQRSTTTTSSISNSNNICW